MEELLNKLIKKGRVPFGESRIEEINRAEQYAGNWNWCCWGGSMQRRKSTRQLVSKESGLWQFVCENKIVKEDDGQITRIINLYKSDETIVDGGWDYHYWLMICSILDESELEDFLLQNIKIEG